MSHRHHHHHGHVRQDQIVGYFLIHQINHHTRERYRMILGVVPGATGHFVFTPLPPASGADVPNPLPFVPVIECSDTTLTLTPSADGLSCDVAVPADPTAARVGTSFVLTIATPDGTVSDNFTVPIIETAPPPPPPPAQSTIVGGFGVNQTS
jgi:hypothetical protein